MNGGKREKAVDRIWQLAAASVFLRPKWSSRQQRIRPARSRARRSGWRDVRFEERAEPRILNPTDAVIRLAATCVCGSDPIFFGDPKTAAFKALGLN